jgi:hypothetical protein
MTESRPWAELPVAMEGNAARAADIALAREQRFIVMVAQRYAPNDQLLADDLAQAARIELRELDPSRSAPTDKKYVRGVIVLAIREARRREWRQSGGMRRLTREEIIVEKLLEKGGLLNLTCSNAGERAVDEPRSLRDCLDMLHARREAA